MEHSLPPPAAAAAPVQSGEEPGARRQEQYTCSLRPYKSYLLIENPSKANNLGPILRCAAAFAVSEVVFVGYRQCSTVGSHGSARHLRVTDFPTFGQAAAYLRMSAGEGGCGVAEIVGLLCGEGDAGAYSDGGCEVGEDTELSLVVIGGSGRQQEGRKSYPRSMPIHSRPFQRGNVAFLVSKNYKGLPVNQAIQCDAFVHVPHVPIVDRCPVGEERESEPQSATTPRGRRMYIDVQACLSIALHHYTAWAMYDERAFDGQKFEVSTFRKGEEEFAGQESKAYLRAEARKEKAAEAELVENCFEGMFGEEDY